MDEVIETSGSVGARLRAAREAQGQTLEDVGRQTRVPVRHLVQIEEGRLDGLPAAPYSAGFVKAYARVVGLDPAAMAQSFRAEFDGARRGARIAYEPYEPADPSRLPPRLLAIVALVIAVLLVGGYAIWRGGVLAGDGPDSRARLAAGVGEGSAPTAAPVARPMAAPPAAPPPAAVGPVVLTAREPVWVSITERAGGTLFTGTIAKGQGYTVPPTAADPVIRLGRPESLDVTVGGKPVAPLGAPATTVSNASLSPAALLARGGATPAGSATGATNPATATDAPAAFRAAGD